MNLFYLLIQEKHANLKLIICSNVVMLMIGVSGSGKTTISRFVAWINGISIFQLKVHSEYSEAEFDEDVRHVLR
uniref:Dynein heavy chain AAA module D4 domain-containing protein n=1 Tax=Panagrolaimus sp. PS1159 TaxID=55785 RepID=A0AC35FF39_9BILA